MQLGIKLHRASQSIEAAYAAAFAAANIEATPRQIAVLDVIASREDAPSQTDIVTATNIDRSTVADMVRRLLKRGLIARQRKKDDARAYDLKLTAAGRRLCEKAREIAKKVDADALSTKGTSDLSFLLEAVNAGASKIEAGLAQSAQKRAPREKAAA